VSFLFGSSLFIMVHIIVESDVCWCFRSFGLSMPANMDMIEQTDLDDVFSLQFVQWTVAQFCFQVLEKVVPCLQGAVDEQLSMQCFELMHQVASLLADSLIAAALWEDTSVAAHELVIKLINITVFTSKTTKNLNSSKSWMQSVQKCLLMW